LLRDTYSVMTHQNQKMEDQIMLLTEKLEFFIDHIKKEQGKTKRGEYFTQRDNEFKGNLSP